MTRHIFSIACCLLVANAGWSQVKPFEINGTLKGAHKGYVYLSYQNAKRSSKTDSTLVKDGKFTFKGELPHPVSAMVYLKKFQYFTGKEDLANFYIEPGKMKMTLVEGDLKNAKLSGSASQLEYEKMEAMSADARKKLKPLSDAYATGGEEYRKMMREKKDEASLEKMKKKLEDIKDQMDPYYEIIRNNTMTFIKSNPQSWVAASQMRFYASNMKLEEGDQIYANMPAEIKQSDPGEELRKTLDGMRNGSPGSVAHVFSKKDINDQNLSLADYKGKYVLIDFWASWCGPCRKGNPHLISLYNKYKEKGFEIIGVASDDSSPAAWKKAVAQDNIGIWKHVLSGINMEVKMKGDFDSSDIGEFYGIHSLPTKILVDPTGKIIGRYGGGGENDEAMDKKLIEIFEK